jgi:hypothetical protein
MLFNICFVGIWEVGLSPGVVIAKVMERVKARWSLRVIVGRPRVTLRCDL